MILVSEKHINQTSVVIDGNGGVMGVYYYGFNAPTPPTILNFRLALSCENCKALSFAIPQY